MGRRFHRPVLRTRAFALAPVHGPTVAMRPVHMLASGPPRSVTFPNTPLDIRALIAPGADLTKDPSTWAWFDFSTRVRFRAGISVTQGRQDETSLVQTSSGSIVVDNTDGLFSRRNPNSPLYGLLTLNTPIWVTVDAGAGPSTRMALFVNGWPTRWSDRSGNDAVVQLDCSGILRRLGQGKRVKSPLRRTMGALGLDHYWPLEDAATATRGGSAVPGDAALRTQGLPIFGTENQCAGSALSVDFSLGGTLTAGLTPVATNVQTISLVATWASATTAEVLTTTSAPGNASARLYTVAGVLKLDVSTGSGPSTFTGPTVSDGRPHHVLVTYHDSGVAVDVAFYVDGVLVASGHPLTVFLRTPYLVALNPGGAINGPVISHVGLANRLLTVDLTDAVAGYVGEAAHDRIIRNCAEEGIPLVCAATASSAMGAQPIDGILEVIRDSELVDGGVLYEVNWGLGYQSLDERTSDPDPAMVVDFAAGDIAVEPEPADDDQRIRNQWKVSRSDGSEATAEASSGTMGTQVGGPGIYDDEVTVNVQTDSQLEDQAGWRLRLGQVDEDRWPQIPLRFHGTPDLIPAWVAAPFGARIQASNPPDQMAPDTIDAVMEGSAEEFDSTAWVASLNTSSMTPYLIATLDSADDDAPRIGSETAFLAQELDETYTGDFLMTCGADGIWNPLAPHYPMDINIGGERITLSQAVTFADPQQLTIGTRSVNGVVKRHPAGTPVRVWNQAYVGLS